MQPARGRFARFDLDRQIASTFPAHWKVGPAPVFGASRPLEPAEWLALLILKAGDVESNPGPQNRKLPPSALTTQTTTLNSTTHSHATTSHPNKKLLTLLQLNINSITNKHEELKLLVTELQPDIITIQETKLKKQNKTPQIPTYSAIRTDRTNGKGGGLLTYIKHNITFSDTKIPNFINPINTELQIIQLHITHKKIYTIANIYIPPRNTTSPDHATCDADITSCIQYITNLPNSIISGDINAHSPIWHSHTTDHRGDLIADLLGNSDHITLNTNTHTRLPFAANQRPTSPDITSITTNLYNRTHWETLNALNSDHLPILTTINTRTNFRLQQNRQTYTNYNKANWQNFTTETESSFRNINPPSDTHTANKILTNIILNADKHNIPKGKIQHNCKLLPEDIRTKINTRNNIRKHNPLDPNLAQLNNKITSDIQHHKQFKAGVPQGGVLSPTLFNIYMSDLPTPPRDIHVTTYADDITIYSSDKNYTIAQQRLQPYLEDVQTWTKANDLKLNASKTMTTLFTPDPAEYRDELSLQLDNTRLPTIRNPKILGLTFDPKLTFNEHIKTSKDKAEKTINILKALTSTHWGKNKETLTNTYKTVTRPILEYAGTIYAPIISDKQLTALQVTQNQGLRIATGCTSDTNINHIHDETKILPIEKHLRLHSSQLRQKASHPDHPLHRLTTQPQPPRLKKKTIFNNNQYTLNIDPDPTHAIDENTIKRNMKTIHTTIVQDHLSNRPINKLLNRPPPDIDKKEETLPHSTRRKLSQLRTNKSPLLMTYLHKIDPANHPAANCPLCNDPNHDSLHLFNCPDIPTTLTVWDLWTNPVGVAALLDVWGEKLGGPRAGV